MSKRSTPVNTWVLDRIEQDKGIVKKLERESEESTVIALDESEELKIKNPQLIVPVGIEVYQITAQFRNKGELFISAMSGTKNQTRDAYLSIARPRYFKGNQAELLKCPWFNIEDTRFIFNRLAEGIRNAVFYGKVPTMKEHPFSNL